MNIILTEKAAVHIENYLSERGSGLGIRFAVKTTGCSGMMYVIEPVDEPDIQDMCYHSLGVNIYVDPKSAIYVLGTHIDFVREGLNEGLSFNNPNVKAACGCGESFTI